MIDGLPLAAGHVLWFGEMHGTAESPRFVGDVVEQAAQRLWVQLGLEIPTEEQHAIDEFLIDGDRAHLVAGAFWRGQDGRATAAMVGLIERVRVLRRIGAHVDIVAFDARPSACDAPDLAMAQCVIAARDPAAIFIGLSGNIHARRTRWNDVEPLVLHLIEASVPVTTYDVVASGGSFWGCVSQGDEKPVCGEYPNHADGPGGVPWTLGAPRDDAFDGVYFVGATTVSRPLR